MYGGADDDRSSVVSSGAGGELTAGADGCSARLSSASTNIFTSSGSSSSFGVDGADDLPLFLLRVIAIMRHVRFSMREALGNVSFAFVYKRHTCVASGSFFLPSAPSLEESSSEFESSSSMALGAFGFRGGNSESDKSDAATPEGVEGDNVELRNSCSDGRSRSFKCRLGRFFSDEGRSIMALLCVENGTNL
ncbi:hypothetical protein BJV82DRAFT_255226 [Fennellomyces sp. T-0311]|nr:hypothetical protein BJV82DRAFT_255226 [Fennellomyces sp. T-0311]